MITREVDPSHDNITKIPKNPSSTSWKRFKDPRIVRVARAFGGKDRHSKVFTVKGLRDRRVRLSVPTALQLYDLQDKLGLHQPSKVVDWLLNEAKHEIDQLPPLQMPLPAVVGAGGGGLLKLNRPANALAGLRKDEVVSDDAAKLAALNLDLININLLKGNSNTFMNFGLYQNDFFSRSAHTGSHHGAAVPQAEEIQNFNVMTALSASTIYMPLSSQVLVNPPAGLPQYFFHPQIFAGAPEFDPKDINFQTLMSSTSENPSSSTRNQNFLPLQNNEGKKTNKCIDQFHSN
ncbi:hypothetical protein HAX54_009075 [Datura stramonium]|uniref:TCP domain-containing protein n=1 Tax=Datura stramonium TaxID=4076 RepID=A0ABS8RWH2_DATST|nr:hypothetical protein [Datura stramonium]